MSNNGTTIENVVCPFCGCLCDDLVITIDEGRIVKNQNGCPISRTKFLNYNHDRLLHSTIKTDMSRETPLENAINQAALIISQSRRLLVYGLSSAENDAHREAYKISELVGGVVDNTSSVCHGPAIIGTQESGEPQGSLAETRNRADLVIYWGANPQFAHPRHMSRYTKPLGEFAKERQIWVFDIRKSITASIANRFIKLDPGYDLEVLESMRAILHGHTLDVDSVGGLSLDEISELVKVMKNSKYGVFFFGLGLSQSRGKYHNVEAAIRLVQDLNSFTRWHIIPMRGHYNVTGANKTSTWQTGYPFAVDFSRGYPRYQPGEYTAVDMLARGECDVLLNIAADPVAHFPRRALKHLKNIPIINLDPKRNLTSMIATVNIPAAIAGIECDGAAVRMDGLPLYLKKVVNPPNGILPDREILSMIYHEVRRLLSL
ncbi:formylmethanofuran dehydrogenase subunit B [Candidatus Thorarchaeota archaeon]|nr:MAG: formylmethanofuran dehydrogenase subunit B [Candidatus Thorarchaeota archaeon]